MANKITRISIPKKIKAMKVDEMIAVKADQAIEARETMNQYGSRFSSYYQNGFLVVTRIA